MFWQSLLPVSYTHLDVYKRQHLFLSHSNIYTSITFLGLPILYCPTGLHSQNSLLDLPSQNPIQMNNPSLFELCNTTLGMKNVQLFMNAFIVDSIPLCPAFEKLQEHLISDSLFRCFSSELNFQNHTITQPLPYKILVECLSYLFLCDFRVR